MDALMITPFRVRGRTAIRKNKTMLVLKDAIAEVLKKTPLGVQDINDLRKQMAKMVLKDVTHVKDDNVPKKTVQERLDALRTF